MPARALPLVSNQGHRVKALPATEAERLLSPCPANVVATRCCDQLFSRTGSEDGAVKMMKASLFHHQNVSATILCCRIYQETAGTASDEDRDSEREKSEKFNAICKISNFLKQRQQ
ncbi:uncharacterized protein [Narcine bancroftii]|uniref:uncharacterized protein isoform X2 n=1 Tax=Narcine bancroftii TaxID=1343680 RepID=UPI003832102B